MARLVTPLTDNKCSTTKANDKDVKLFDGNGLYLLVKKNNGSKIWRFKYIRPDGRATELSVGKYPTVTLKEARDKREEYKKQLAQGIDPSQEKKKEKAILKSGNTFKVLAIDWLNNYATEQQIDPATYDKRLKRLENHVFPLIGDRVVNTLKFKDFLNVISTVKSKGKKTLPADIRSDILEVMRHAILTGIIETNPALDLLGLKLTAKINHHPALPHKRLKEFLDKIDLLDTKQRLIVLINLHVFIRSSELRYARWEEIDFKNKIWTIPESREAIKNIPYSNRGGKKRSYIVPLTDKVIEYLTELKQFTGNYDCIFVVQKDKPIACSFINSQLRKLGYDTRKDICGHGFRAMARSALGEAGFNKDALEKQMSHEEEKQQVEAYTHLAEYLEERKIFMQWWSDYLEYVQEHNFIPPFEFKKQTSQANNVFYLMPHFQKIS